VKLIAIIAVAGAMFGAGVASAQTISPPPEDPNLELAERLRDQLFKERKQAHAKVRKAYRAGMARVWRKVIRTPDAEVQAQLAGIAYGQSPQQLISCASSEGYAESIDRYSRFDYTTNKQGSGASGSAQFMPSTFASTPMGKAGMSIWRVATQFHAMAWMWSVGRRGEWAGAGC
jgi:hypothetical protein